MFILGYRKSQLFNFILGRAKIAVYLSRKKTEWKEKPVDEDAVSVLVKMLKACLKLDFNYYRMMKDLGRSAVLLIMSCSLGVNLNDLDSVFY